MKDVEFKMRTRTTVEIFPDNRVMSFSEKCPGCENKKTAKLSDSTLIFWNTSEASIEKQGREQPNAEV